MSRDPSYGSVTLIGTATLIGVGAVLFAIGGWQSTVGTPDALTYRILGGVSMIQGVVFFGIRRAIAKVLRRLGGRPSLEDL